jgi:Fe-S-cluster containining protein
MVAYKDNTIDGNCSGCGECCTDIIPLTKRDVKRLKKLVKDKNLNPNRRTTNSGNNVCCPFLNDNIECSIYKNRPIICKSFKCNINKEENAILYMEFCNKANEARPKRAETGIRKIVFKIEGE